MTISEAVFEYRKKNKVSQRDLAKLLGVTDSVIHRIESGQTFRLTESVRTGLRSILTPEQIESLDETNDAVVQLKRSESVTHKIRETSRIVQASESNLRQLEKLGYSISQPQLSPYMLNVFDFFVGNANKSWYISASGCNISIYHNRMSLTDLFWRTYGAASCINSINKLSFIFRMDVSAHLQEQKKYLFPHDLPFDVSILYFNENLSRLDKEVILHRAPAGKGFYDFESPETRERDQYEYIQWTFLLSQGFINDPTQR